MLYRALLEPLLDPGAEATGELMRGTPSELTHSEALRLEIDTRHFNTIKNRYLYKYTPTPIYCEIKFDEGKIDCVSKCETVLYVA